MRAATVIRMTSIKAMQSDPDVLRADRAIQPDHATPGNTSMARPSVPNLLRDLIAVLWVTCATVATWAAWPDLEPTVTPFFLVAITVSGWLGGLRGGLIAAALST